MVRPIFLKKMSKKSKNKNLYFFSDVKLVFVRRTHHFDTFFFSFWFVDTFSFSTSALFSSRLSRLCDSFLSPPHRRHWLMWLIQSIFPHDFRFFLFKIFFFIFFFYFFPCRLALWLAFITFFCLSPRIALKGSENPWTTAWIFLIRWKCPRCLVARVILLFGTWLFSSLISSP